MREVLDLICTPKKKRQKKKKNLKEGKKRKTYFPDNFLRLHYD
jgi:hypothetical protein